MATITQSSTLYSTRNRIGLFLGPMLFAAILLFVELDPANPSVTRMAAAVAWIATWWISEAIPIPATSLLPLVLFPLLKIDRAKTIAPAYMDSMIFLFMGGFIIALAIERWNLHKRIALVIIRKVGGHERRIILGFMVATALLSMWISNTACAMMMLPIGLAVVAQVEGNAPSRKTQSTMGLALMLGIAYAASIGGIGTPIGTPPNLVLQGFLSERFPECEVITFQSWMVMALPFVALFLVLVWILLVYVLCPIRGTGSLHRQESIEEEYKKLGPMTRAERRVLLVFLTTALLWIFRKEIALGAFQIPGWSNALGLEEAVNDSTVALSMALLLFLIPGGRKPYEFLMDWKCALRLPWGILLLFGGGLALARGMETSGFSLWLGCKFQDLGGAPEWIMILSVSLLITFLTEITSNTATVQMILPVLATAAVALKINPLLLMIPATLSASCAFMLPVATPPNAIVFGSGFIPISTMARVGIVLNLVGVLVIYLLSSLLAKALFGIESGVLPTWAH
jgi:sodium-dependent dicarboxylate transporter 2/3/5